MKSIAYYPVCLDGNGAPEPFHLVHTMENRGICSKPGDKIRLLPGNIPKIVKGNNGNRRQQSNVSCKTLENQGLNP